MVSRTMFVCFLVVLASACTPQKQELNVATLQPQLTPETATATLEAPKPSATATPLPTPIPANSLDPENLGQVELLHQYWLKVAAVAGVNPYEMDVSAVAASPDGQLLAVGGCSKPLESDLRSGNIYCNGADSKNPVGLPFLLILNANTQDVIGTVPENKADITIADLAFTNDGKKLIYAIQPGRFAIWDVAAGQIETVLWEGETSAPKIAISPDGNWVALKTSDQVNIWDSANGEFVAEIPANFRPQFSADSSQLLVYYDKKFNIYETGTWKELVHFDLPCDCVYALSPDLSLLATSERAPVKNAPILVWDVSTGKQIQSLKGGLDFTTFLAFSPNGQMLWRAGEHGDLTAWDTNEWKLLAENIGGLTPILNLGGFQFVGDGRHYLLFSYLHIGLYGVP